MLEFKVSVTDHPLNEDGGRTHVQVKAEFGDMDVVNTSKTIEIVRATNLTARMMIERPNLALEASQIIDGPMPGPGYKCPLEYTCSVC